MVALTPHLPARHQPGRLEDPEVLHHAEPGHARQRRLELSQRLAITLEEPVQQRPPIGLGQRPEHLVVHARTIGDQIVTCQAPAGRLDKGVVLLRYEIRS